MGLAGVEALTDEVHGLGESTSTAALLEALQDPMSEARSVVDGGATSLRVARSAADDGSGAPDVRP